MNVINSEVRIRLEDFRLRHAICNTSDDRRDRDPQTANARHAAHLIRITVTRMNFIWVLSNDTVAMVYLRGATASPAASVFDDKPLEKRSVKPVRDYEIRGLRYVFCREVDSTLRDIE